MSIRRVRSSFTILQIFITKHYKPASATSAADEAPKLAELMTTFFDKMVFLDFFPVLLRFYNTLFCVHFGCEADN